MRFKLFVILGTVCSIFVSAVARHVNIDVKAPWRRFSGSSIVELAEFIGDQNKPALFWAFVDGVCHRSQDLDELLLLHSTASASASADDGSLAEIQSIAYEVAATVVPQSMQSLMETLLTIGGYSPAVICLQRLYLFVSLV